MKIGIDLGTANVLVYVKGKGIVITEPSVVAVSDDNRIVAVGEEAREMIGRTPGNIQAIRPMKDGVIADYVITEAMLRFFIAKATKGRIGFNRPEVMISVPAGVTSVEKRAVRDAALKAGAREAFLIEEPLAAAIGANVPISGPSGNMIIDIGGGTSEIAVIALGGIVVSHSLRVGGNKFDESIATYIRKKYNLMIGERTAEEVKIQIGTALPLEREMTMEVRGRDLIAGLPRTIPITSSEVMEAIEAPLQQLVAAVRSVLEQTPPELSSDIIDKGMVMSGGGALLRNIDRLLTQVTGVPCHVAEDPLNCVALGTGLALEHFDFFKKSLVQQIWSGLSLPRCMRAFIDLHCHTDASLRLVVEASGCGAGGDGSGADPPCDHRSRSDRRGARGPGGGSRGPDGHRRAKRSRPRTATSSASSSSAPSRRGSAPSRPSGPHASRAPSSGSRTRSIGCAGRSCATRGWRRSHRSSTGSRATTHGWSAAATSGRWRSRANRDDRSWRSPTPTRHSRSPSRTRLSTATRRRRRGCLAALASAELVPGRASYIVRLVTPIAKVVQRARGRGRIQPGGVDDGRSGEGPP